MNLYKKTLTFLSTSERKKIYILLLGFICSGILEAFGIGIIMPFIAMVNEPDILNSYPTLLKIIEMFGIVGHKWTIITFAGGILIVFCVKNLYLFFFMRFQFRFMQHNAANFSIRLLKHYLSTEYLFHLQTNSSILLRNIKMEVPKIFSSVLGTSITLVSEIITIFFVISLLLYLQPLATIVGGIILGIISIVFYRSLRKKSRYLGKQRIKHEGETYKWITQSLNSIKELNILGVEKYFLKKSDTHYQKLARISVFEYLISQTPRLFLETLMIITLMLMIILLMLEGTSMQQILPTLALFAAAAFRLMPSINRILGSVMTLRMTVPSVEVIYGNLKDIKENYQSRSLKSCDNGLAFSQKIQVTNLSFSYPNSSENSIKNLNFVILKNSSIGIMGHSGAGKSTLLNLLLGLLQPEKGDILVDDISIKKDIKRWQNILGFVPQEIYLTDDTIKKNIAYGIDEVDINDEQVWKALQMAQLEEYVKSLPEGLNTIVGERGARISGGQKQRVGIARALYRNPEILIFDEATSALDSQTENEITKSIEQLASKKTIIIVAHRLTTIQKCDTIYNLQKGQLKKTMISPSS